MTFVRTHIHKCEFGHVFIREWAQSNAKGIIHIHHGMMEHSGMYHTWAKELNYLGWTVIAHDQPGFGYSVINECDRNHISVKASMCCIQVGLAVESWIRGIILNKLLFVMAIQCIFGISNATVIGCSRYDFNWFNV